MFLLNSDIFIWDLSILLFMTFSLCGGIACITWTKKHPEKSFQRVIIGFLGFLVFLVFLVITYASFIEPQIIVVTKVTVTHPQAQPLKIAVVSDPHVGPYKGDVFLQRVVKRINSLLPLQDLQILRHFLHLQISMHLSEHLPYSEIMMLVSINLQRERDTLAKTVEKILRKP